ncbi:polysaccharide biosynthesis protein [Duganella vulcania]|uniref:Polysaccharide biosynthesis protein n=1 Tax=Duganella vulcania TaxID=2692166 RepID=A0A845GVF2_9BURK|nr:nucleoside-diphosphate sugar epimerase/dehydratase [Duganella vulcania]MYM97815.1 polysaccharide biosynthesis protein [Duganella vulcania]
MLACTPRYLAAARLLSGKLIALKRGGKRALMFGADGLALPLCFQLALLMRGGARPAPALPLALLLAATSLAALSMSDLYGAAVRYLDQRRLALGGLGLAGAALCIHLLTLDRGDACPPGALLSYWFVALSYLVASRLAVRSFLQRHTRPPQAREAVAIYGAGDTGARLAQAMQGEGQYCPVCFFDEKARREQRTIAGLRVFPPERLAEVAASWSIRLIVVALPAASGERMVAVSRLLDGAGVGIKFLRGLPDLADHAPRRRPQPASRPAAMEFPLEQLLGRPPVQPDPTLFSRCVRDKGVLVTGAGGSIGSELCRQIAGLAPRCLHLLDHSEFALYTIAQELQARWPRLALRPHLGSACNARLLERVMRGDRIDTVYHAAAYKHVPLVETNLVEGLRNNVLGAQAVARAAARHGADTCVLVSSDKAVRPSTIMGASKRLSELVFQAAQAGGAARTVFSMVRFGNVLGSSGSVVPLFRRQLQQGGPLTVTDAAMERYFMLIPEAAQLVIQAGAMAEGGDLFVLDMGQPVRIVDLARRMIALAGLTEKTAACPQGDIEIRYVGLYPGEKLREELLAADDAVPSRHPRILRMKEQALAPALLDQSIELLLLACATNDRWLIEAMLQTIIGDFAPHGGAPAADGERARRAIARLAMAPQPAHAS